MAQEENTDLNQADIEWWIAKTHGYSEQEIAQALLDHRGAWLPKTNEILDAMDLDRERRAEERRARREAEEEARERKRRAEWLKTHPSLPQAEWPKEELRSLAIKMNLAREMHNGRTRITTTPAVPVFEGPEGAD
jgi:hypothetical protein